MTRLSSIALIGFGVLACAFGLLFLVGAGGVASRYVVAAVGLALGAAAIGTGVVLGRRADRWSPERVRAELLELAKRRMGELSAVDIDALLGERRQVGRTVLDELVRAGLARTTNRDGATWFLFEGLLARMTIRTCPYCRHEASLNVDVQVCPRCGGDLRTETKPAAVSDGLYKMD